MLGRIARPHLKLRSPGTRVIALALVLASGAMTSCEESGACTEIGCESEATVTFDSSINEVYTLVLDYGPESVTVRCNDAGSLESQDNPEWLDCNPGGFSYTGPAATEDDIIVSLTLDDSEQTPVISNELVSMGVTEDGVLEPNGPGCLPVCFERFGSILLPSAP
jgi:hypothetical protein